MSGLLTEAVVPALDHLELEYFSSPRLPGLIVPLPLPAPIGGATLLMVEADDDRSELLLHAHLCTAPPARRAPLALFIAELNARFRFITLSMTQDGTVQIDSCVDLTRVPGSVRADCVRVAAVRLICAIRETFGPLLQTALLGSRRRPRLQREIDQVLRNIER